MKYKLNPTPLLSAETIKARVAELGKQISGEFGDQELIVIGVLKGSFVFLADLIRSISCPLKVEFIGVSSYEGTASSGHVRITHDLAADIKDKAVLLVEDIVDTGETLDYLIECLNVRQPASLKVCTFLDKPGAHKMKHLLDFVGFEIGPDFVVGYGLDVDGQFRQIPYLAKVETEE